ncbi:MAG: protease HtpX [Chlamydiales bacterium]|nr:protease HtpX [Chlamydiales bacterium]
MAFAKRIILFLALNFLVVIVISTILQLLNVRPYLEANGINYRSLLIFCLVWGMGGAFISLSLSRIMAKWMMGVQLIDPKTIDPDARQLLHTVYELADSAKIPRPQVGVFRSNEVNAFATGPTQSRSLVAVSTGLLNRLNPTEIKAVLGHEITHISNGDMVTMTLLQGVVNAFVMFLARVLAYAFSNFGRSRDNSSAPGSFVSYMLFTYLFEVIFMILGSLLIAAYSRFREFRADAGGAKLTSKEAMIAALQALKVSQNIKDPKADNPAMAAFKISHPEKKGILHLFATHPSLDVRIERLRQA